MNLYLFASTSVENVIRAIANRLWAVPPMDEPHETARRTRATSMRPGAAGLFYCSDIRIFTTPFVVESEPEDRSVSNVWENTWYLPFAIRPIGDLSNSLTWNKAVLNWPFLRDEGNRGGLVTAARVFAPIYMPRTEWDDILKELGLEPEEFEDLF